MRKKICLLLLALACFIFTGCSKYPAIGLINNADGTVVEYYYIPFPEAEIKNALLITERNKVNTAKINIKTECDKIIQYYIDLYQSNIEKSDKFTLAEKKDLVEGVTFESNLSEMTNYELEYIKYSINFASSTCYNIFKNINKEIKEERQVITEKSFFTTTTKVIKDPLFDKITSESITLGKSCVNMANTIMQNSLGMLNWTLVKNSIPNYSAAINTFNYIYVVPTSRIHTNADEVLMQDNYYFHIWKININNLDENNNSIVQIQYWTTSANRVVWYLLALGASAIVIAGIFIAGHYKEKSKNEK